MRYGMYMETNRGVPGRLYLAAEDGCIVRVSSGEAQAGDVLCGCSPVQENLRTPAEEVELLLWAAKEIEEYLAGERERFTVPVRTEGTDFQRRVWEALRSIPYGETRSYGEIAKQVDSPRGARAVGMACHRNPLLLLIPCHRVVGAGGKLVGFAGGLSMKEALLRLEQPEKKKGFS